MSSSDKYFKPFLILWSGQALSLMGSQVVQFGLIWWLTEETGSATVLATASLVGFLPVVVLSPLIGVWVDRWNRRLILFVADLGIAVITAILLLLFWLDIVAIWHIYLLLFIRSIGGAFHGPAMQASTTLMVPEKQLTRVQGMNQMLNGGLGIVAAPLGAIVVSLLPMAGVLAIDVITAVFAIVPLLFIVIPQPKEQRIGTERPSFWQDFRTGLAYVWGWPAMIYIVMMAMAINFLIAPAISLLPLMVSENLDRGAYFLSVTQVSFGIGIVLGGILLTAWGGFKRRIITVFIGLLVLGASMLLIGVTPNLNTPNWAILFTALTGLAMTMTNGPIRVIMQTTIAPEMQGRVFSLIGSMSGAMAPLGLVLAGPLAERFGVPFWFIVSGGMTVLMAGLGFLSPTALGIENGRSATTEPLAEEPVLAVPTNTTV